MEIEITTKIAHQGNHYTASVYGDAGQRMVYLSDDAHGDVTIPFSVFIQIASIASSFSE